MEEDEIVPNIIVDALDKDETGQESENVGNGTLSILTITPITIASEPATLDSVPISVHPPCESVANNGEASEPEPEPEPVDEDCPREHDPVEPMLTTVPLEEPLPVDEDCPDEHDPVEPMLTTVPPEEQPPVDEEMEPEPDVYHGWVYDIADDTTTLSCLAKSPGIEFKGKCLRGCKWAPDGSCLLTNSEDRTLRLFNIPTSLSVVTNWTDDLDLPVDNDWESVLKVKEGGQVYDYCWFPFMSSMDPETACFLTSAQDNPIHLWDAFTGQLRATYVACNYADIIIAALSITFDAYGEKIYCGYRNGIRIFDVTRPGRQCIHRQHKGSLLPDLNLTGIVSCIAVSPYGSSCYACGSFDKRIGIYMEDGSPIAMLQGHTGGLTHLKFNRNGTKLYSGSRKDSRLICWDMRNLGTEYEVFERVVETSQRIYFDLSPNEKYLVSGSTNGEVRVWDLESCVTESQATQFLDNDTMDSKRALTPSFIFPGSTDCVNGVSLNPYLPLMAVSTGQRHFADLANDEDEEIFVQSEGKIREEIGLRLFKLT